MESPLENPPCNEGQPPDILLQSALRAEKDDLPLLFRREAEFQGTLLEIAAGYGHIVIKAREAGAGRVFANEIDAGVVRQRARP